MGQENQGYAADFFKTASFPNDRIRKGIENQMQRDQFEYRMMTGQPIPSIFDPDPLWLTEEKFQTEE